MTTGAGLRAWGLAHGLKAKGFDVLLATPLEGSQSIEQSRNPALDNQVQFFTRDKLKKVLDNFNPDVIIMQHWGLAYALPDKLAVPLILDLAGPHLLERKYWGNRDAARDRAEKIRALRSADYIICGGEIQRRYFYPFLTEAGYHLPIDEIPVIPFSPPPVAPVRPGTPNQNFTLVYGGAFLAWQNPEKPLRWLLEVMDELGAGRLLFYGGSHPSLDASAGRFIGLFNVLQKHPRVEMRGWKSFDTLCEEYATECHVALDLMERNEERELAYTTRTLIYMYCGLPVIYNNYSEVSQLIERTRSGWTLDPDDETGFKDLVRDIILHPEKIETLGRNAQAAALNHNWEVTIEPLAKFCNNPSLRPGKLIDETPKIGAHKDPEAELHRDLAFYWDSRNFFQNPGRYIGILIYIPVWILCRYLCNTLKVSHSYRAHEK